MVHRRGKRELHLSYSFVVSFFFLVRVSLFLTTLVRLYGHGMDRVPVPFVFKMCWC